MYPDNAEYLTVAADGVICNSPCIVFAVFLTAGADAANVIIYNNASAASGSVIVERGAVATASSEAYLGVKATNGLYADVSGTTPSCTVVFKRL